MKKALYVLLTMLVCMSFAFATGASESSGEAIQSRTIHFSTTSAEGTEIVNVMRNFADMVNKESGGKITVEIYPGSQLGSVNDTMQNCQLGVQEMAVVSAAGIADVGASAFKAFALPYVFRDEEHLMKVCQGSVGQEMLDSIATSNTKLVGIGYWSEGTRNFITKTPIRSLADVKGMKLRCQALDVDTDMCVALGASPTHLAF
ncbi:MAG: TRAP transporter substrate-binding protein DctP, partial [Sphaerochaetaceae bacterium]|nr:TRAP transporter substrate-binding protein DctP [Sphaerochaetaceae bacterium]